MKTAKAVLFSVVLLSMVTLGAYAEYGQLSWGHQASAQEAPNPVPKPVPRPVPHPADPLEKPAPKPADATKTWCAPTWTCLADGKSMQFISGNGDKTTSKRSAWATVNSDELAIDQLKKLIDKNCGENADPGVFIMNDTVHYDEHLLAAFTTLKWTRGAMFRVGSGGEGMAIFESGASLISAKAERVGNIIGKLMQKGDILCILNHLGPEFAHEVTAKMLAVDGIHAYCVGSYEK